MRPCRPLTAGVARPEGWSRPVRSCLRGHWPQPCPQSMEEEVQPTSRNHPAGLRVRGRSVCPRHRPTEVAAQLPCPTQTNPFGHQPGSLHRRQTAEEARRPTNPSRSAPLATLQKSYPGPLPAILALALPPPRLSQFPHSSLSSLWSLVAKETVQLGRLWVWPPQLFQKPPPPRAQVQPQPFETSQAFLMRLI